MKTPGKREQKSNTARDAVVIAGDIIVDHHLYEGERSSPSLDGKRGVRVTRELGGAVLIERLLVKADKCAAQRAGADAEESTWSVQVGVSAPVIAAAPCKHHAYAVWTPHRLNPREEKDPRLVWRADKLMGYGHDSTEPVDGSGAGDVCCPAYAPEPLAGIPSPRILVLDDAGFIFRQSAQRAAWLLPRERGPEWIVLKTARPVAQG